MMTSVVESRKTLSVHAETYLRIRNTTKNLVAPLQPDDLMVQPVVDISPPKWHLAHTTWFFETLILKKFYPGYREFNKEYAYLFNSYYNSLGNRLARDQRGMITRPGISEVMDYRQYVDEQLIAWLRSNSDKKPLEMLMLGLNHEQQHQELLVTDIKFILGSQPSLPAYHHQPLHRSSSAKFSWLDMEEGIYETGARGDGFSYDIEHGLHKVYLQAFSIMDRPVTNASYMEFIETGGYTNPELWLADGWELISSQDISAPMYWFRKNRKWYHYTLGGVQEVDPDAPVCHISLYEADAYARYSGCRLPTEHEWEAAARKYESRLNPGGCWADTHQLHPFMPEQSSFAGGVWEWTGSAFLAYPGYRQLPGPEGEYNGKWMSGQMVLRGGSCATPFDHYRHSYRNFFQPEKRWQFSGVRLARDIVA